MEGTHAYESPRTKYIPFPPICQCTTENEMKSSRPLSFLAMSVLWAYVHPLPLIHY